MARFELKYGCNPNQKNASISCSGELPLEVLNGNLGYINALDALNGWQLVKELKKATGYSSATSFKHVSPAGVGIGKELSERDRKAFFISSKTELSPIACAYARARGSDRMSSFGDFISLSDECDEATALLISKEVSDGIIAPSYTKEALEILKKKKSGGYTILKIDPDYEPDKKETRTLYGLTLTQDRNDFEVTDMVFSNPVTVNKIFPSSACIDMTIALVAVKYTQSNSVVLSFDGQTIGIGAGQQSRLHCTRLASDKADLWRLKHSDDVLSLPFKKGISRNEKDNIIEQYLALRPELDVIAKWSDYFLSPVKKMTMERRDEILSKERGVSLSSDAFFPFSDNIDRAARSGVSYITEPGGSIRDNDVIASADKYNMTMFFTSSRLFHH